MAKDNIKFYENFDWKSLKSADLEEKIQQILEMIPADVQNILDVGCGNGAITNVLAKSMDVTAVDRSKAALKFVNTKKIEASADAIPLPDRAFDLVFSSEMLEHLDDDTLEGTVKELDRLTKKYLLLSVPNDENPDKLSIRCPNCQFDYNRPNHLRSFNQQKLAGLFPEFKVVEEVLAGKKVRYYSPALIKFKKRLSPPASWIPYYWIPSDNRKTMCPSCEHQFEYHYKFNVFVSFFDVLNALVSPKKAYWMMLLLKRK